MTAHPGLDRLVNCLRGGFRTLKIGIFRDIFFLLRKRGNNSLHWVIVESFGGDREWGGFHAKGGPAHEMLEEGFPVVATRTVPSGAPSRGLTPTELGRRRDGRGSGSEDR